MATSLRHDPKTIWLLRRLYATVKSGVGSIELTTLYDDGMAVLADFRDAFPGRRPDPTYMLAKDRCYRHLYRMIEAGWVDRFRQSNYDIDSDEPKWLTQYSIRGQGIELLKELEADEKAKIERAEKAKSLRRHLDEDSIFKQRRRGRRVRKL